MVRGERVCSRAAEGLGSVSEKIAVLAALAREVRPLVGNAEPDRTLRRQGVYLYRVPGAVIVAAGMGAARASVALAAARDAGEVAEVVSVGLAGACAPEWLPGTVVEPAVVVDARTGERFVADGAVTDGTVLVSAEAIASVREKARLAATYGAGLVDMEAATVARLARAHGMRFRAVKGISDAHDFELASLGQFADSRGEFRTAAFAWHTALRPGQWRRAMRLGRHSQGALTLLGQRMAAILDRAAKGEAA